MQKWHELHESLEEAQVFLKLIEEEKDESNLIKLKQDVQEILQNLEQQKIQSLLNGENDSQDCYLSIHTGAGGADASDWAQMLYRMYTRWGEKQGYKMETLSFMRGEEAGIKYATFLVKGLHSFGYLKGESGVHRLIRISPFNSSRHTSFASVFVWPDVGEKIEVVIRSEDLRIDTYRAGGAGGQHVNRTDSAVRITHLPTDTVVQCQNQRSQHANKDRALKMLKAALYNKEQEKKEQERQEREASKKANEWGSQIRTYVLNPYQMVKDHRTEIKHSNPEEVLNGDIDIFIRAYLKQKKD